MADVDRSYDVSRHVEMGKAPSEEIRDAIRELSASAVASR